MVVPDIDPWLWAIDISARPVCFASDTGATSADSSGWAYAHWSRADTEIELAARFDDRADLYLSYDSRTIQRIAIRPEP